MDQVFYVLAIMGCDDSTLGCRQVRMEPARYASQAACQLAMPAALERNLDLSFPTISAACTATRGRVVQASRPSVGG